MMLTIRVRAVLDQDSRKDKAGRYESGPEPSEAYSSMTADPWGSECREVINALPYPRYDKDYVLST